MMLLAQRLCLHQVKGMQAGTYIIGDVICVGMIVLYFIVAY